MEHMKGYDLKRFFPALAWGVSCIIFLLVIFFICSKYGEYRLLCNVGLVDDGIDELHTTLLSVSVGALVCLSGIVINLSTRPPVCFCFWKSWCKRRTILCHWKNSVNYWEKDIQTGRKAVIPGLGI